MPQSARKIGLFGGSFDPPHNGHIICAKAAADSLGIEKILVIPAAVQPLKPEGASASIETRLRMVKATFAGDPIFEICTLELDRGGKSYTVDTIRDLQKIYKVPEFELVLILGADTLADIPNWREPDEVFRLTTVASMVRKGRAMPTFPSTWQVKLIELDTPQIDISSSEIRQRIALGRSIGGFVPREVERIIITESLYIIHKITRAT